MIAIISELKENGNLNNGLIALAISSSYPWREFAPILYSADSAFNRQELFPGAKLDSGLIELREKRS